MHTSSSPKRWSTAYNLAILAGGELLTKGMTFLAFVHLARVLTPSGYGLIELTLAVMLCLTLIVDQGLSTIGTQEIARDSSRVEALVRRIVSAQIILAGTVYLLFMAIVLWLPIGTSSRRFLLGWGASLLGVPFFLTWVFQGREQMTWVALPQVLRWATFTALVLSTIHSPGRIWLLPFIELVAVAIAALANLILYVQEHGRIKLDLQAGFDRRLFAESLPIGGSQIIWALRMYLPTLLLGGLTGPEAVGLFGAAHRIVMVFQTLIGTYFINLLPTMSQASYHSSESLTKLLSSSLRLTGYPALAIALATTLAAPTIIGCIFGAQYTRHESITVLAVLIWTIPILIWRRHARTALITLNYQREELFCSVVGVAFLVGLAVPLIYAYGPLGSAWALVVSEFMATVVTWLRLKRHLPRPHSSSSPIRAFVAAIGQSRGDIRQ